MDVIVRLILLYMYLKMYTEKTNCKTNRSLLLLEWNKKILFNILI